MAWPPPVLPIDRTNADPQQDTHPADHNALALAANDLVVRVQTGSTFVNPARVLGTIGTMGTYTVNKQIRTVGGYSLTNTDATGQITVAMPAGLTAIMGASATPFFEASEMGDVQWLMRVEQSSLANTRWMARSTTTGLAYPNARVGVMFTFLVQ